MSVQAIRWAMKQQVDGPAVKAALLVIAEHANPDGLCWPSVSKLAEEACTDPRSMRRFLTRLRDAGLLDIEASTGRLNRYRLRMETPDTQSGVTEDSQSGVAPRTDSPPTPDSQSPHPGPTVRGPRTHSQPNHQEPSRNRQIPARESEAARSAAIATILERTGKTISEEHASLVVRQLTEGRAGIRSLKRYVVSAIERDPDPRRFLPTPMPPRFVRPEPVNGHHR